MAHCRRVEIALIDGSKSDYNVIHIKTNAPVESFDIRHGRRRRARRERDRRSRRRRSRGSGRLHLHRHQGGQRARDISETHGVGRGLFLAGLWSPRRPKLGVRRCTGRAAAARSSSSSSLASATTASASPSYLACATGTFFRRRRGGSRHRAPTRTAIITPGPNTVRKRDRPGRRGTCPRPRSCARRRRRGTAAACSSGRFDTLASSCVAATATSARHRAAAATAATSGLLVNVARRGRAKLDIVVCLVLCRAGCPDGAPDGLRRVLSTSSAWGWEGCPGSGKELGCRWPPGLLGCVAAVLALLVLLVLG